MILLMREKYGTTFKIRLFSETVTFVTDSQHWTQIHRNANLLLPVEDVAKAFDASAVSIGLFETNDLTHEYVQYLQGKELKQLTLTLAQHIRQALVNKGREHMHSEWIECGLFELSHMLLFESSIKTLYGDIDPLSFEREYRIFDSNIHVLMYPYPTFIFKQLYSSLIKAKQFLIKQLYERQHHPHDQDQLDRTRSLFVKFMNDLMCKYPEQTVSINDIGSFNLALLWSAIGNTIPAVYWALFYLLTGPTATIDIIKKEIQQHLSLFIRLDIPDENNDYQLDQLDKCVHLDSAIDETLRLVATAMILRRCSKDTKITLDAERTL
ncbi:unnamed protein product, partial [Didymodactylos carnosus]